MVQLICPLCGKFTSIRYFDPGSFENDVLGVDTVGLGRGLGTRVVAKFSLLDDSQLMGTIRDRCHLLVGIIDGKSPPDQKDLAALKGEVERWRKRALDRHKEGNDLEAKIADMEGDLRYWQNEAKRLERLNVDSASKVANMESSLRQWQYEVGRLRKMIIDKEAKIADLGSNLRSWYNEAQRLERLNRDYEAKFADDEAIIRRWSSHCTELNNRINRMSTENHELKQGLESKADEVDLAHEEMEEILEMINTEANTDFEYLVDAVEFLLEVA
jgi:chromosome segregation ATPase